MRPAPTSLRRFPRNGSRSFPVPYSLSVFRPTGEEHRALADYGMISWEGSERPIPGTTVRLSGDHQRSQGLPRVPAGQLQRRQPVRRVRHEACRCRVRYPGARRNISCRPYSRPICPAMPRRPKHHGCRPDRLRWTREPRPVADLLGCTCPLYTLTFIVPTGTDAYAVSDRALNHSSISAERSFWGLVPCSWLLDQPWTHSRGAYPREARKLNGVAIRAPNTVPIHAISTESRV